MMILGLILILLITGLLLYFLKNKPDALQTVFRDGQMFFSDCRI